MAVRLEKIQANNFKSLKDFELELKQFNVLIGTNGSGKTNVLELFKFIKGCIDPQGSPIHPFASWWGYNNIVWYGKEKLSISFSLQYDLHGIDIIYDGEISGQGGILTFLNEEFKIDNVLKISRESNKAVYIFEKKLLNDVDKEIQHSKPPKKYINFMGETHLKASKPQIFTIPNERSVLRYHVDWSNPFNKLQKFKMGNIIIRNEDKLYDIGYVSPIFSNSDLGNATYFPKVMYSLVGQDIILISQLNLEVIRQPAPLLGKKSLSENGEEIVNILFSWYNKNGKLPDRITYAMDELFPNWRISFTITEDGRIMMSVNDGDLHLSPKSIPDGFYKMLAILIAVELKPDILLIDELDTSLHSEIIDYMLDTLKTAESTVIVTTHSPLVIDLVELEDLVLLEMHEHKTCVRRIKEPNEIRQRLQEDGITPSESWIYARL